MEGGWKPWRIQRIECASPHLDDYGKPLPPPPTGWYWERLPDKSWELRRYSIPSMGDNMKVFKAPSVLEHVVLPNDTIQGICLRYRISAVDLRRYNLFSGNNFKFKKTLRIPIEPGAPVMVQLNTPEVLQQVFQNITGESAIESRVYLDEHKWDLEAALAGWKADDTWTKHQFSYTTPEGLNAATPSATPLPILRVVPPTDVVAYEDGLNEEGFEMPERGHSYPRLNTEDDYDVVTHAQVESETALSQPLLNGR